ncbi:hypothetical protein M3X99_01005 [Clostridium perfringens]|mgnify:CR=1 FL=1|uniref:hypothetical protein n=2 Tax=Clostridium perfringens TaxID=1502 RepID=UPI001C85669D|nr:hypothetical protein [Clostridium perfringens]ELC8418777.1 hypothetical protein [Clostridium perfringens]MDC4249589.1 hypothetical protein [Clostridium perfringens]MDU1258350.1 hypothetical protein [Clostridium perfringens]
MKCTEINKIIKKLKESDNLTKEQKELLAELTILKRLASQVEKETIMNESLSCASNACSACGRPY